MKMRRRNSWNTYQRYRKLARSGERWAIWAFNFVKAFTPKEKLEAYESHERE